MGKKRLKKSSFEYDRTLWLFEAIAYFRGFPIPKILSQEQQKIAGYWGLGLAALLVSGAIFLIIKFG
jgi:hypothetical protein